MTAFKVDGGLTLLPEDERRLRPFVERIVRGFMPKWAKRTADDGHVHWEYKEQIDASSDLTIITSAADVAGCTLTLPRAGVVYTVTGIFDFDVTSAVTTASTAVGSLTDSANTPIGPGTAILRAQASGTPRATVSQQWLVTPDEPNYVVKLRAIRTGTGGTFVAHEDNTTILAEGRIGN